MPLSPPSNKLHALNQNGERTTPPSPSRSAASPTAIPCFTVKEAPMGKSRGALHSYASVSENKQNKNATMPESFQVKHRRFRKRSKNNDGGMELGSASSMDYTGRFAGGSTFLDGMRSKVGVVRTWPGMWKMVASSSVVKMKGRDFQFRNGA